jgi:hypothetical protein
MLVSGGMRYWWDVNVSYNKKERQQYIENEEINTYGIIQRTSWSIGM